MDQYNTQTSKIRLKFISYLQIICIILVVLGHSFHEYTDGEMGQSLFLYRLLYNVRMPIFVFVSGFLMYYTSFMFGRRRRTIREFTVNKVKRLLIPYLVLSVVTFVPRAKLSSLADDSIPFTLGSFFRSIVYSDSLVIPYFWFIQMSFILLILAYSIFFICGQNTKYRQVTIWILASVFVVLPFLDIEWSRIFAINEVVRLGIYFVLGIIYCCYQPWADSHFKTNSALSMIVGAGVWITIFIKFEYTDLARFASVFGIYAFVCLSRILENNNYTFLDHLQGANYLIFLLSWYVNVLAQQVLSHFVSLPWWVYTMLSLICGIYIPWICYRYLISHANFRWVRVVAFLLGQNISK